MNQCSQASFRRLGFAGFLICLIGMVGCALPQYEEQYVYEKDGVVLAEARRYAGNTANPIHTLWISAGPAPEFEIRLPDGAWVRSTSLTFTELARHGMEVSASGDDQYATWHPAFAPGALAGRHAYLHVHHDKRDSVTTVSLGACGWSIPAVIRTPGGQCLMGFPADLKNVECLLGPPSRVKRVALMTRLSCF